MGLKRLSRSGVGGLMGLAALAICLVWSQAAMAVQTDMYANFTKCPTTAPAMNDPASSGVVCVSGLVRGGSLKVGNFQTAISSPMHLQFGLVSVGEEEQLDLVPGSTSLDSAPFVLPNPFYTPPPPPGASAPSTPSKKKQAKKHKNKKGKKHGKHKKGKKGKKGKKHGKHKKGKKGKKGKGASPAPPAGAPTPNQYGAPAADQYVKATLETVGDLRNLHLSAVFGEPTPLFELPLKLHLEGAGLGPSCYIGSDAEPIVLTPSQIQLPNSFQAAVDPNGFGVEILALGGSSLEDASFAVPAAGGCGTVDPATQKGSLDGPISSLLGLPAAAGSSKAVLGNLLLELAAAINDGVPPDGGATLQAAFEAAK